MKTFAQFLESKHADIRTGRARDDKATLAHITRDIVHDNPDELHNHIKYLLRQSRPFERYSRAVYRALIQPALNTILGNYYQYQDLASVFRQLSQTHHDFELFVSTLARTTTPSDTTDEDIRRISVNARAAQSSLIHAKAEADTETYRNLAGILPDQIINAVPQMIKKYGSAIQWALTAASSLQNLRPNTIKGMPLRFNLMSHEPHMDPFKI